MESDGRKDFQDAWRSTKGLKHAGRAKSIGVSNYLRPHVEATLKTAVDPPSINQLEFHPYLQRANNYPSWMQEQGIAVEAFRGLTPIARVPDRPLVGPIKRMAKAHSTTETCVMLASLLQKGVVAVTTTRNNDRLQEYLQALDVELTQEEVDEISTMGDKHHVRFYLPERYDERDRS